MSQAFFTRSALQWGHRLSAMEGSLRRCGLMAALGFNGAIAFQRWKACVGYCLNLDVPMLQWGHRLSAMEGLAEVDQSIAMPAASMGPSPFSDGRMATQDRSIDTTPVLQWGHRLSAMEGSTACEISPAQCRQLQWGHRLSAMEGPG